jgi:hypothetical protein
MIIYEIFHNLALLLKKENDYNKKSTVFKDSK